MSDLQLENVEVLAQEGDAWYGCKDTRDNRYCQDPWGHHISLNATPRRHW